MKSEEPPQDNPFGENPFEKQEPDNPPEGFLTPEQEIDKVLDGETMNDFYDDSPPAAPSYFPPGVQVVPLSPEDREKIRQIVEGTVSSEMEQIPNAFSEGSEQEQIADLFESIAVCLRGVLFHRHNINPA